MSALCGGCGFIGANGQEAWLTSVPQEGGSDSGARDAPNRCSEVSWARDQIELGMAQAEVAAALGTPDEVGDGEAGPQWT